MSSTTPPAREEQNVAVAIESTGLSALGSDKAKALEDDGGLLQSHASTARLELTADACEGELAYSYPEWKKWWILTVIFLVQTSMNFNTSLYSNGLSGIANEFDVSEQVARLGAALFLILYAFGCELWAPWSEELGRKPIMQASLFLVNVWTLPVALAPNFASLLVGRCLGGLSSAGGSVTLGMIADMFDADHQQYPVAYIVFSSVGGSILGPIVGGFVQQFLSWRWCIWIQLIFGGSVQLLHLFTVPETRATIMIDNIAKKRRKMGHQVWGPNEIEPFRERFTWREVMHTWIRPFHMFLTEPIVLVLSLLSGFADALIFMQIQSFSLVYAQWGFNDYEDGLAFIPIGIGYAIAWLSFVPAIKRNMHQRQAKPEDEHAQYESRLWWLLFLAPCLPLGLFIFAFTCNGPPIHWVGSMVASGLIGMANYAIYMATIDYMICAYGPYSASATGGNGWARDFLAGVLTCAATPFYQNIPGQNGKPLLNASIILFCISVMLVIAVYVIYRKGPELRKRSPFAETLARGADTEHPRRHDPSIPADTDQASSAPNEPEKQSGQRAPTPRGTRHAQRRRPPHFGPGSRTSSYTAAKEAASRNQSRSRNRSRTGSRVHSFEQGGDGGATPLYSPPAAGPTRNSAPQRDVDSAEIRHSRHSRDSRDSRDSRPSRPSSSSSSSLSSSSSVAQEVGAAGGNRLRASLVN